MAKIEAKNSIKMPILSSEMVQFIWKCAKSWISMVSNRFARKNL